MASSAFFPPKIVPSEAFLLEFAHNLPGSLSLEFVRLRQSLFGKDDFPISSIPCAAIVSSNRPPLVAFFWFFVRLSDFKPALVDLKVALASRTLYVFSLNSSSLSF